MIHSRIDDFDFRSGDPIFLDQALFFLRGSGKNRIRDMGKMLFEQPAAPVLVFSRNAALQEGQSVVGVDKGDIQIVFQVHADEPRQPVMRVNDIVSLIISISYLASLFLSDWPLCAYFFRSTLHILR